jgi:aryl-alcohol dehydrogenase-like predicted oxidoreductase
MEYRKLGDTDLEISAIAFGAWAIGGWMWGGTDMKAAQQAILASLDEGVTSIDTAPVYGFGLSERIVGETLKGKRHQVQLLTKFGLRWDIQEGQFYFESKDAEGKPVNIHKYASKAQVIKECEECLARLKTDYLDLFQLHWPDPTTPIAETMEALEILLQQGKIRAAGVCNYNADQMQEAGKSLKLASNQVPYSMVLRQIEEKVVPLCLEQNVGILAYSPLQRGLLTGKLKPGHAFAEGDHRGGNAYFRPRNIERVNQFLAEIQPIANDKGASLSQLVLRWTVDQPGITSALAGARNAEQALQNAKSMRFTLTEEEMGLINQALEKVKLDL